MYLPPSWADLSLALPGEVLSSAQALPQPSSDDCPWDSWSHPATTLPNTLSLSLSTFPPSFLTLAFLFSSVCLVLGLLCPTAWWAHLSAHRVSICSSVVFYYILSSISLLLHLWLIFQELSLSPCGFPSSGSQISHLLPHNLRFHTCFLHCRLAVLNLAQVSSSLPVKRLGFCIFCAFPCNPSSLNLSSLSSRPVALPFLFLFSFSGTEATMVQYTSKIVNSFLFLFLQYLIF